MALWRVLDYTSATLRVAVKHPPNNSLKLGKKTKLKAERIGAFAAKPLCDSPRNLRTAAYLSFSIFFTPMFYRSVLFRAAFFWRRLFLLLQTHFSTPLQFLFHLTKTIENSKKTLKLPFNPFTLFL